MKQWIKAVRTALRQVIQYAPLLGWWYLLLAGWALFVAYPVHHLLSEQIGHSLSAAQLVEGFDYTLWNDFKNAYGSSVTPILDQSILVLVLAALSMVFVTGGTFATLLRTPTYYEGPLFWGQSAAFFWRLLRLTLLFWLLHGLVLGLFLGLFYVVSNGWAPFTLEHEGVLLTNFRWIAPFYLLALGGLFLWQDLSKLALVRDDQRSVFRAAGRGMGLMVRGPIRFGGWMLAYSVIWSVGWWSSTQLQHALAPQTSIGLILTLLLISQLLVGGRLALKIMHWAVLTQLVLHPPQKAVPTDSSESPSQK